MGCKGNTPRYLISRFFVCTGLSVQPSSGHTTEIRLDSVLGNEWTIPKLSKTFSLVEAILWLIKIYDSGCCHAEM